MFCALNTEWMPSSSIKWGKKEISQLPSKQSLQLECLHARGKMYVWYWDDLRCYYFQIGDFGFVMPRLPRHIFLFFFFFFSCMFLFWQWRLYLTTGLLVLLAVQVSLLPHIHTTHCHSNWKMFSSSAPLQQLRANMREMEKLCTRVRAEDADALEALIKPVRDRASAAAQDFLRLHSNPEPQPAPASPPATHSSSCASSSCHTDDNTSDVPGFGRQSQVQLPEIPPDQRAAESWDNLEEVCTSGTSFSLPVIVRYVLIVR